MSENPGTPRQNPDRQGWQHDVLASLRGGENGATAPTSGVHRVDEVDADRTVLRPAPKRPVPSAPAPSSPVPPPARTTGAGSHATPSRPNRLTSPIGRMPTTAVPAPAVIASVPGPELAVRQAMTTQLRSGTSLVTGPGPEFRDQLAKLGRTRGDSAWVRVRRALARVVGRDGLPSAFETAATRLQTPVTTGRRVAVVGADGGVGHSTLAAVCALVYASLRRDVTAVVSLDTAPSPIGLRLGVESPVATSQLAQSCLAEESSDPMQVLLRFTKVAPSLVCSGSTTADQPIAQDAQAALCRVLSASAAVSLLDCPSGLDARSTRQAVAESHALLLVGSPTAVGVDHIRQVLDQVAGSRPVVVALVDVDRARVHPAQDAIRRLARPGVSVHHIGWDRHLAAGGHLHLDHLAEPTRQALAELTADLLDQARKAG